MTRRLIGALTALALGACAPRSGAPEAAAPSPAAPQPPAGDPTRLEYSAGSGRYQAEGSITQELMGQSQSFSTRLLLTASFSRDAAGLTMSATVDSISADLPQLDLSTARGRTFVVGFSASGQPRSLSLPDTAQVAVRQVGEDLREFLPLLPTGTVSPGFTWTDTVQRTVPTAEATISYTVIRTHLVVGWEDRGGTRALQLSIASSYTLTGTGETQGQAIEFDGSGRSVAEAYVSAAGVYLGNVEHDTADVMVNVVAAGMQIPVRRVQRSQVTRLP
jgi:hypothetical protein